jgi:hypothetical protein
MTLGKRALSGSGSRGGAPAISPSYWLWLGWLQPKPWPETSTTRPALGSRAVGVMGIPLLIPSQAKRSEAKQARRQATPRAPARRSAPRGWWPVGVAANRHRQVQNCRLVAPLAHRTGTTEYREADRSLRPTPNTQSTPPYEYSYSLSRPARDC